MIANTGAGEFSTFVAHPSLCDGQWHTIAGKLLSSKHLGVIACAHSHTHSLTLTLNLGAGSPVCIEKGIAFLNTTSSNKFTCLFSFQVIKGGNVIQVDVDAEGNYTVGPNEAHTSAVKESVYLGGMPGE